MTSFTPAPEHAAALRSALGSFATGVTVVTTHSDIGPVGITVNSFTSVSLDPPLVLWCPALASDRHDAFARAKHFAIHILTADQQNLSEAFARSAQPFDLCDWTPGPQGVPLIQGCCTRLECATDSVIPAGDHSIILGRVSRVTTEPGTPLVFQGGHYGQFKS